MLLHKELAPYVYGLVFLMIFNIETLDYEENYLPISYIFTGLQS